MEQTNVLVEERKRKLAELKELGINPFPYKFNRNTSVIHLKKKYEYLKPEEITNDSFKIAGRLMSKRVMGKASFAHIQDQTGRIQLYLSLNDTAEYDHFKKFLDIGDIWGVEGTIFKTKTGEITLNIKNFEILCKSLKPLPEKFHGLKDDEIRYRHRELDLIMNEDIREIFTKRSMIIKAIRDFMESKGFMEVETPLLQTLYGGGKAKPFVTHINAWDMDMYLSISPELYLKRLIIGGYEKVYTICKNFRNEGVDYKHNPEFTMLEAYESYSDYSDMMKLIEECYEYVCLKILGTTKVKRKIEIDGKEEEVELDFKSPWKKKTMAESIKEELKIDIFKMDKNELYEYAKEKKLEAGYNLSWGDLVILLFDELVESKIIQPTHIIDRPRESSPLCKGHRSNHLLIEQCEPICAGMEVGNIYSELNDPFIQRELFEQQEEKRRAGDEEANPSDENFLQALETGMPPTGGIGWGVDRMVALLLGQHSLREIILFPTMKPKKEEEE